MEMEKTELVQGRVDWRGRTALKHKHGGMRTTMLILAAFGFENMATLALAVNLGTYFNEILHYESADAANLVTNYMGTCYILTVLVAVFADTCLGRFRAVVISGCIEFLGLALLTIQSHFPNLRPPLCNIFDPTAHCEKLKTSDAAFVFISLYLIAAGTAGTKAALPSHGADQFDEKDPKETRQMSTFFNWLLLALCLGGTISLTFIVWIQDNKGFDWGFGTCAAAMLCAVIVFISGWPLYRIRIPNGASVIVEIIQVYVAAIRNRKLNLPDDPNQLYEIDPETETTREPESELEFLPHRDIYKFLDKAAVQTEESGSGAPNPWRLCRVTQVENSKIILGMTPIFLCTIIMTLCLAQLQTFSVQQGITMDTRITKHFKIPPASLPIIPVAFLVIIIPFYDQIVVPFLRKFTNHAAGITHLQRIGVGLILSSVSMATAAIMEWKRKSVARSHNMLFAIPLIEPPLPISVFWLSFQYFIFGIADMFTYVGLLEFFYSEAPKALKSVSTCFLWSSMAMGYFLSTIMVKIVNAATKNVTKSGGWLAGNNISVNHLDLFYALLSVMSFVNFCVYLVVAMRYEYRPSVQSAVINSA